MKFLLCWLLAAASLATAAPNVLNGGSHAANDIAPAINAVLGSGHVDTNIFVDYNAGAVGYAPVVALLPNTGASNISVASGSAVNHAPYLVGNASYCCGQGELDDQNFYVTLVAQASIFSSPLGYAVSVPLPAGTGPPTVNSSVSSSNSTDGGSNWGIEFGLAPNYLGLTTTSDSSDSAYMAGFLAALRYKHSSASWFDIKAALRQTASNWPTWSKTTFGYGSISFAAADSLLTSGTIYLQPPGMQLSNMVGYARAVLYPFQQSRRAYEVIYSVSAAYSWPAKNEYTTSDIAASGATLLYTSPGSTVPETFNYFPSMSGSVTFVAFTTDGMGNFSAVQAFGPQTVTLVTTSTCTQ